MIPTQVLLDGSDRPASAPIRLRAGPLTMLFDVGSGSLRDIRLGDVEVIRGIYAAVRDRNWGTLTPVVTNLRIEAGGQGFHIAFDVDCRRDQIDFAWRGTIVGGADGTVRFEMHGEARSSFLRNRIGFCVLHPGESCAGRPCTIEHVDGTIVPGSFPELISPHQPFTQMRALRHEIAAGLTVEARMEGDVFEMEDQRNWTDASFKTYCTPLALAYPVEIPAGTRVDQAVTLRLIDMLPPRISDATYGPTEVRVSYADEPARAMPRIGLAVAYHGQDLDAQEVRRLRKLGLDHLRVDLDLSSAVWQDRLRTAAEQARAIGNSIEAAALLGDAAEEELAALAGELERSALPVATWLILHRGYRSVPAEHIESARRVLSPRSRGARLAAGTNANFAELNRNRPAASGVDMVCYSINPQVHAFDNASLMETLRAQPDTVRSARQLAGRLPVAVTPVTLRPRFNAVATGAAMELAPGELPPEVDVRQMSLFGAAWTLGSMARLFEVGADSVTFYETTGWRGVMETVGGASWPPAVPSLAGAVFPMYHVFADVGEFHGGRVLPLRVSRPNDVAGLALTSRGRTHVLLGNLRDGEQIVVLSTGVPRVRVRCLDQDTTEQAMHSPEQFRADTGERQDAPHGFVRLPLRPYAVACVDMAGEAPT
ncbi:MAG: hypothetical protein HY718_10200 [Planctomycetes bacterium]|nr:hypothetical protein [Planctomycetota bacterium]